MEIQLNYNTKTLSLMSDTSLYQLLQWVEKHLEKPHEWTLNTQVIINNWTNPLVIREYDNYRPWWIDTPYYTISEGVSNFNPEEHNNGIYNIKIESNNVKSIY